MGKPSNAAFAAVQSLLMDALPRLKVMDIGTSHCRPVYDPRDEERFAAIIDAAFEQHAPVIAMLREVIDEWPGDAPAVVVSRDIEFHGEDAPRPDGDGWVPCGVSPERRQRITIEMTSGPTRISSWRKLTQEELDEISAFEDDDE